MSHSAQLENLANELQIFANLTSSSTALYLIRNVAQVDFAITNGLT